MGRCTVPGCVTTKHSHDTEHFSSPSIQW